MKTAIFLGAGASAAEGAPMQSQLFKDYFGSKNIDKQLHMYEVLGHFFKQVFQLDVTKPAGKEFPTFEEGGRQTRNPNSRDTTDTLERITSTTLGSLLRSLLNPEQFFNKPLTEDIL